MVHTLLSQMEGVNVDNQGAYKDMLYMVFEHAPNLGAVWELFKNVDLGWLFTTENERVNFFVKFYQDTVRGTNAQNESSGAKLIEFYKIPEKMRGRMRSLLFSTLPEYAKTDEEPSSEHVHIIVKSVISKRYLSVHEVLDVLTELSEAKSLSRQCLLPDILNSECLEKDWRETPLSRKVDICKLWVITRLDSKSRVSSLSAIEKIATVYEAINEIMQCSLNITNTYLAQEISTYVVEKKLEGAKAISVLGAFASIEKCVAVVQNCYKSHVCKTLEQTPEMEKKLMIPNAILNECSKI